MEHMCLFRDKSIFISVGGFTDIKDVPVTINNFLLIPNCHNQNK